MKAIKLNSFAWFALFIGFLATTFVAGAYVQAGLTQDAPMMPRLLIGLAMPTLYWASINAFIDDGVIA